MHSSNRTLVLIASLISKISLQPDSEEDAIIISSDSDNSILKFNGRKARQVIIAF